jgi:hypothetical protein
VTASTPVERVAEVLAEAEYKRLPEPLNICGLEFDVPAAFIGTTNSTDLILVTDTAFQEGGQIQRTVEGIARALDVTQSRRPITVVIAGPRPPTSVLSAISKVCRVLPIGDGSGSQEVLHDWLAVLLPLTLPEPNAGIADPLGELAGRLQSFPPEIVDLAALAGRSREAVRSQLERLISEPLEAAAESAE